MGAFILAHCLLKWLPCKLKKTNYNLQTMRYCVQRNFSVQDFNPGLPEFQVGVLPSWPQHSIFIFLVRFEVFTVVTIVACVGC
jgi:hypothetical protein